MGLDGGTVITRSDVLRGSSWRLNRANENSRSTRGGAVSTSQVYNEPSLDRQAEWRVKWSTCTLSEQPLAPPIVADRLGSLFNRDSVLEWLLSRRGAATDAAAVHRFANQIRTRGAALEHLGSLKDVFAVDLAPGASGGGASSSGASAASASGGVADAPPPYACPVTALPCGRFTMVALVPCGHVVSQRALDAVSGGAGGGSASGSGGVAAKASGGSGNGGCSGGSGSGGAGAAGPPAAGRQCPVCGTAYKAGRDDVIMNGTEEQVAALRERMQQQRQLQKDKKGHKAEKGGRGGGDGSGGGGGKRKRDKGEREVGAEQAAGREGGEPSEAAAAAAEGPPGRTAQQGLPPATVPLRREQQEQEQEQSPPQQQQQSEQQQQRRQQEEEGEKQNQGKQQQQQQQQQRPSAARAGGEHQTVSDTPQPSAADQPRDHPHKRVRISELA